MIRKLVFEDKKEMIALMKQVFATLEHPDWFIPFDDEEYSKLLTEGHDMFYGYFEEEKLLGISGLFLDKEFFHELAEQLSLDENKTAELGGSMVLPECRGKNIMYQINCVVIEKAREMDGLKFIAATVHPDNKASSTSAQKVGLEKLGTYLRKGKYLRNLYLLKL